MNEHVRAVLLRELAGMVPGLVMLSVTIWVASGGDAGALWRRVRSHLPRVKIVLKEAE